MIFFLKPRDSVKTIMKDNGLLSVNQIHHLEVAKVMQRHALKSIPLPFTEIFKKTHACFYHVNQKWYEYYPSRLFHSKMYLINSLVRPQNKELFSAENSDLLFHKKMPPVTY